MISIRQYLLSVSNSRGLTRTLGELDLCRDVNGRPIYSAGNSAVVFKLRHAGRTCALRCYTHPARHLSEIYGDHLLREELFVYRDSTHGEWMDVVLNEWIEGQTLHDRILEADAAEFAQLAESFDTLAATLVVGPCAHGDLKPENIIVTPDGTMRLIDLDASFLPAFTGEQSPELGTAAFQHPSRTADDFDARLDDFPATLISTALHALALDVSLRERHDVRDTLMINPQRLPHDPALTEICTLFERRGRAIEYRIARQLLSPTLRLRRLKELLAYATQTPFDKAPAVSELFVEEGLWGYRDASSGDIFIPPIYDCGFDFTEGLAAVQLGRTWYYIDPKGRTAILGDAFSTAKPFRNGHARVQKGEHCYEIDRAGNMHVLEY